MKNEIEKAIENAIIELTYSDCPDSISCKLAILALEKQLPKQILINSDGYYPYYPQCPNCLKDIGKYHKVKCCPECGQALLWVYTNV